ncbi:MAG TPA: hypothetical protein VIP98_11870, partial [Microlunatus sp.]
DDDSRTEVAVRIDDPIAWALDQPATAAFYTLTSSAADGDPSAWRLEGSVDGEQWTLLDERSDQAFRWRRQTRPFKITNPGSYRAYRLVISAADQAASLSEVELLP